LPVQPSGIVHVDVVVNQPDWQSTVAKVESVET
jgi:hypothetical protein